MDTVSFLTKISGVPCQILNLYSTSCYTEKKDSDFPFPAGMSLTKLTLVGNNLIIPGQR